MLAQFCLAAVKHWVVLVTGSILTAGIVVFQWTTARDLSPFLSVGVICFFLLWAVFKAWKDERHRAEQAERNLAKLNEKPALDGEFVMLPHPIPDDLSLQFEGYNSRLFILVFASLWNRNEVATTVKEVSLVAPAMPSVMIQSVPLNKIRMHREEKYLSETVPSVREVSVELSDLLGDVTRHPIQRGVHREGYLCFSCVGSMDKLTDAFLRLEDAFGNNHEVRTGDKHRNRVRGRIEIVA